MESEMGPQMAARDSLSCSNPPFFQYQFFPGRGCEGVYGVRQTPSSERSNLNPERPSSPTHEQKSSSVENGESPAHLTAWKWDCVSFKANPTRENEVHTGDTVRNRENDTTDRANGVNWINESPPRTHHYISSADSGAHADMLEQKRKQFLLGNGSVSLLETETNEDDRFAEDAGNLSLKLGGSSYSRLEESQNCKRYRSSSPGSQYPMCQVDDCRADLTHAKDYHRRHKVCEKHSKASKALVHRVMQRFCQQCSRFHPLNEFDEIKRSCRRRLAGHNRRRRKTQPDVGGTGVPLGSEAVRGSDLWNILALLSRIQSAACLEKPNGLTKDQDQLLQDLKRAMPLSSVLATPSQDALSAGHAVDVNCVQRSDGVQKPETKSQAELVTALASFSPDALSLLLQNGLRSQTSLVAGKFQPAQVQKQLVLVDQSSICPPTSFVRGSADQQGASDATVRHPNSTHALSLLSPQMLHRPASLSEHEKWSVRPGITGQYLMPDHSRRTEDDGLRRVNSSGRFGSYLAEQTFFPVQSGSGRIGASSRSDDMIRNSNATADKHLAAKSIEPQKWRDEDRLRGELSGLQKPTQPIQQASDNSDSGSDQSPASSSSDPQERTGRIILKLFDVKNPADLPQLLRPQILEWLSQYPSDMESYIRPGCIIVTIFLTMPVHSWKEFINNLHVSLRRLVTCSPCGFWSKGRILVQVEQQRVFIINGKIRNTKFSRSLYTPRLRSVRPVAIKAGEETTLVVHGANWFPGTKIICSYQGKHWLQEIPEVGRDASANDPSACLEREESHCHKEQTLHFPAVSSSVVGRCFIEVEHELTGAILPVIIADSAICSELQTLEEELDATSPRMSSFAEDELHLSFESCISDSTYFRKEKAINFLHELGWLFQRSWPMSGTHWRFRSKALLNYAVEHDWCAVVKKILDMIFESQLSTDNGSPNDIVQILSEVNLVHIAVKRKCKLMVELLLQYRPVGDEKRAEFIFTPNMVGPAGLTPLHIGASLFDAEEIIDALTNDPYKAGLHGWKNVHDALGKTPEWYALNSGNISYVQLVEKKITSMQAEHLSILINDRPSLEAHWELKGASQSGNVKRIVEWNGMHVELPVNASNQLDYSSQPFKSFSTCRGCSREQLQKSSKMAGIKGTMYRPLMISMVAIATLCVCVTLFLKGPPHVGYGDPFTWEEILYGSR